MNITELGCIGHCIIGADCRWRRHTQVGDNIRISTIGDYLFDNTLKTVGAGDKDFFETMVFKTVESLAEDSNGCGCHEVTDWGELECVRYVTAGEAQLGHEEMIRKYSDSP